MDFAEHREVADEAAKAAALEVADEMRAGGGWTLDDIIVGVVPSAVAAWLARLRTPEAVEALVDAAWDYAPIHGDNDVVWRALAVLAGDDE